MKPTQLLLERSDNLGVGYWGLGIGYWVLGVGYWVLGVGFWVLSVSIIWGMVKLFTYHYSRLTDDDSLMAIHLRRLTYLNNF